jgi:hypothetical protein
MLDFANPLSEISDKIHLADGIALARKASSCVGQE